MELKVRFFDYPLQFKNYENEYMEIIRDTLSRGAYIHGEDLNRFERNLARFTGAKFAIGVSSCTDALLLSLHAAGISHGDEVITVSHTFVATVEVIKFLGAKPILVDITDDHCIDVKLVENAITPKTKAIVPVQLNGRICTNMDKLIDIAKRHNLIIIEDSAQALGAKYKGRSAGTFGLSGNFSFYPAKLLGAFGDAGAVVTNDENFAEKIRMLRDHGRAKGTVKMWGLNCRLDNLQAAILDFKLKKLPDWIKRRREIARMYHESLSNIDKLKLPPPPTEDDTHYDVFQNYEIEAKQRDELMRYLRDKKGIEVVIQWGGKAVHQFESLGLSHIKLPRTEKMFENALMLPIYPELKDEQISYIIESIKEFYNEQP